MLSTFNPRYVEIFKIIDANREVSRNLRLVEKSDHTVVLPCIQEFEKLYSTLKFTKS